MNSIQSVGLAVKRLGFLHVRCRKKRRRVVAGLREHVAGPGSDRFLAPEIEAAVDYVASGAAVRAAETVTGPLQ